MKPTNKLSVKLKSPSGEKFEVLFDTVKYQELNNLLDGYGYSDHKVIKWKLKRVIYIP